jgi:hypothetical protein
MECNDFRVLATELQPAQIGNTKHAMAVAEGVYELHTDYDVSHNQERHNSLTHLQQTRQFDGTDKTTRQFPSQPVKEAWQRPSCAHRAWTKNLEQESLNYICGHKLDATEKDAYHRENGCAAIQRSSGLLLEHMCPSALITCATPRDTDIGHMGAKNLSTTAAA